LDHSVQKDIQEKLDHEDAKEKLDLKDAKEKPDSEVTEDATDLEDAKDIEERRVVTENEEREDTVLAGKIRRKSKRSSAAVGVFLDNAKLMKTVLKIS